MAISESAVGSRAFPDCFNDKTVVVRLILDNIRYPYQLVHHGDWPDQHIMADCGLLHHTATEQSLLRCHCANCDFRIAMGTQAASKALFANARFVMA